VPARSDRRALLRLIALLAIICWICAFEMRLRVSL
jgi:hypothetical protein